MTRNNEEFKIHVAVVEHLRTAFPQVLFTHPAQKAKDKREGHFNKMMGVRAGTPDLILWYTPEWLDNPKKEHYGLMPIQSGAIELKSSIGRRSPKQGTFEAIFKQMGGKHAYCHSVREVHDTLISWGLTPVHNGINEPDLRTEQDKFKDAFEMYKPMEGL